MQPRDPDPEVDPRYRCCLHVRVAAAKRTKRDRGSRTMLDVLRHPIAALATPFRHRAPPTDEDRRAAAGPQGRCRYLFPPSVIRASAEQMEAGWPAARPRRCTMGAWSSTAWRGFCASVPGARAHRSRSHAASKDCTSNPGSSKSSRRKPSWESFALRCRETVSPSWWSASSQGNMHDCWCWPQLSSRACNVVSATVLSREGTTMTTDGPLPQIGAPATRALAGPRHHTPRRSDAPPVGRPARAARRGTQGRPLARRGTRRAGDVVRRWLVAGYGAVAYAACEGRHTLQSCRSTWSRPPSTHTTPVHSGGGGSTPWGGSSSTTILRHLRFDLRRIGSQACCSFGLRNRSRSRTDCTSTSVPTIVTWRSSG